MIKTELLIDLKATNFCQVVTLWLEVKVLDKSLCCFLCRRLTRTQLAVDIKESFILSLNRVLLKCQHH